MLETFNLGGNEDYFVSTFAPYVDGTMFRVSSSGAETRFPTPLTNGIQTLPQEVEALPEFGFSPDGLPYRIRVTTNDPVEMALVPAGSFIRGREGDDPQLSPQQSIYLDSFYMDITEVTVERYSKIKEPLAKSNRAYSPPSNYQGSPDAPAVGIGHGDAVFYAKWAGKDLPTEAQWEKAARGADGARYPWGNGRPLWTGPYLRGQIDPVGRMKTDISPFGILGLAGNAREWCRDYYSAKAYAELGSSPEKLKNPIFSQKASGESHYVVRGVSDDGSAWERGSATGTSRNPLVGFRCVYQVRVRKSP